MLVEVFGDHLFFLTRKNHKSPKAPSTYQHSDQKQQMTAQFRLNTLRMRVNRILKEKQLTSEFRCSKLRNYFVLSWKWLNCSPHLILTLDFWMCFDEKTTTNKRKLGIEESKNHYLVRDINSPIYFHQSTNIFLTKIVVMIILLMLWNAFRCPLKI